MQAQQAGGSAAPKRPLTAYLRLSVDRDGNKIGYDVQRAAIEDWAAREHFEIGHWYQDKDITAADLTKSRPDFEQMLADVGAGMWGGIVVWRLDRLVRLTREFAEINRICEGAKAHIYAISGDQQMDTGTPAGLLLMWLLVLLADMEIRTMKTRNKAHQRAKAELGKYKGGGPRPFGFVGAQRDDEGHVLNSGKIGIEHVPSEAALLREAAQHIAWEGWSWSEVVNEWNSRTPPVVGSTGAPFSVLTLQRILTGPRIAGRREFIVEDPDTGEVSARAVKAVWEPIIDEDSWERLNSLIVPSDSDYGPRETYLLSGILLCGRCKRPLTGAQRKYVKKGQMAATLTYRCKSGPGDHQKGSCGKLNVLAEPVEKVVIARVLHRIERLPDAALALKTQEIRGASGAIAAANGAILKNEEKLRRLAERYALGDITEDEWMAARRLVEEQIRTARSGAVRASKSLSVPIPSASDREDLCTWFESGLTLEQKRAVLTQHIREVVVLPTGRSGPIFNPARVQVLLADSDVSHGYSD